MTETEQLRSWLHDGRVYHAILQHSTPSIIDAVSVWLAADKQGSTDDDTSKPLILALASNRRVRRAMERSYVP